jgi:Lhr-like helicase
LRLIYISPLKALGNDIERNLRAPLDGIREAARAAGLTPPAIEVAVRSGDTPASARARMTRTPPHILITTPESLYILLTSQGGRRMLSTVRTVIVDEIHAVAGSKRGSHLAISLERLRWNWASTSARSIWWCSCRPRRRWRRACSALAAPATSWDRLPKGASFPRTARM